jgi:hypothetical protein
MAPLAQGATGEPRPQPDPEAPPRPDAGRPAQRVRERAGDSAFGTLALRVQPRDAAMFVDGEEWTGPEGTGPLLLDLGAGSHDVEVRKEGFTTYRTTVRVRAGETAALNVSLAR